MIRSIALSGRGVQAWKQVFKIKSIAPRRPSYKGGCSTRLGRFDLHQTRYRPKIYRWFPENVTLVKFYWCCQGVVLTSATAEVYSVFDNAHQRYADLLLAVEHVEQQ